MTRQDHTHQRFGAIVLEAAVSGKTGYWRGRCDCGNPVEKRIDNLKRPGPHSCGQCHTPTPTAATEASTPNQPAIVERVARLEAELAQLKAQLAAAAPQDLTSVEAKALWQYMEEMKAWLKNEIGNRLRAAEDKVDRATARIEEVAKRRPADLQPANLQAAKSQAAKLEPVTPPLNGQPTKSTSTPKTATCPIYPIRPGHVLRRQFYCRVTPDDGYELSVAGTNLRPEECLGFYDTLAEVREAITSCCCDRNCAPEIIATLFQDEEAPVGSLAGPSTQVTPPSPAKEEPPWPEDQPAAP